MKSEGGGVTLFLIQRPFYLGRCNKLNVKSGPHVEGSCVVIVLAFNMSPGPGEGGVGDFLVDGRDEVKVI